jgi:hypothetical protein
MVIWILSMLVDGPFSVFPGASVMARLFPWSLLSKASSEVVREVGHHSPSRTAFVGPSRRTFFRNDSRIRLHDGFLPR